MVLVTLTEDTSAAASFARWPLIPTGPDILGTHMGSLERSREL